MSTFVSIATLEDPEIINTVNTALNNADEDVHVGVAFTTDLEYFLDISSQLFKSGKVSLRCINPESNTGVGKGRHAAREMYDGQDYFLQVDAHTNFEKSWDTKIIKLYNEALEETKTDKTILTGIPNKYLRVGDRIKIDSHVTRYPIFIPNHILHDDFPMLQWGASLLKDFPGKFKNTNKIVPANKFTASFAFGNSKFADFYGLPEESVFFEEEILQTINLLSEGFRLAFPNTELPITHYDYDDISNKSELRKMLINVYNGDPGEQLWNNFTKFINDPNNLEKCEYFEKYSGYRLRSKIPAQYFVPKNYVLT